MGIISKALQTEKIMVNFQVYWRNGHEFNLRGILDLKRPNWNSVHGAELSLRQAFISEHFFSSVEANIGTKPVFLALSKSIEG